MVEEKGTNWVAIAFKLVALFIVTFLPLMGVSWFLAAVRIVHPEWMGSAILTCGFIFFVGGGILVFGTSQTEWGFSRSGRNQWRNVTLGAGN